MGVGGLGVNCQVQQHFNSVSFEKLSRGILTITLMEFKYYILLPSNNAAE